MTWIERIDEDRAEGELAELYRRSAGPGASYTAVDLAPEGALIARFDDQRLIGLRIVRRAEQAVLVRNIGWSVRTLDPPTSRVIVVLKVSSAAMLERILASLASAVLR